ncbi:hypothetical protein FNV43_RR19320 [Rhamnella rubrinervis]|uniref:phosphoglycerate mutase (2,3-diphosphoglycerate-dependent) n=1 Tax=Rhamnella rubrinervis TaxID=2594499 RepID=A0A8K0E7Y3_9ROSA|nr:hypothetical protein FNV43_RR19320 [Rhamnella rubrinervis]
MGVAVFLHQYVGSIKLYDCFNDSGSPKVSGTTSLRFNSKDFAADNGLYSRKRNCSFGLRTFHIVQASTSVISTTQSFQNRSNEEAALILIRHGESFWNERNLFTGCVDVALTKRGVDEAIEAGKRISNIPIDMIYTSALIRAQMTAMLAMTQHRCKKVPIIIHNESEQAKACGQISSEETKNQSIPVITAWQLNERIYGELQGLNKQEIRERYGEEQVHEWRRSYDIPPPGGESLEMCSQRAVAYFREHIEPHLQSGKHVMVAAHANSLRSIIMYLDKLTSQEVISLELSTGVPLLYICKEGKYMKRGSPVGPTEAGVFAYTKSLAIYRQELDEILHSTFNESIFNRHSNPDANHQMAKAHHDGAAAAIAATSATTSSSTTATSSPENSVKNEKKKRSIIPRLFQSKKNGRGSSEYDLLKSDVDELENKIAARRKALLIDDAPYIRKSFSERQSCSGIESLNLSNLEQPMAPVTEIKEFRMFVGTWNVGGKTPNNGLNLEDFLKVEGSSDIYVLGFQEIVPLSAGNVLVIEDNEPAAKWLSLIHQALNKPYANSIYSELSNNNTNSNKDSKSPGATNLPFFQKPSLKVLSKSLRADSSLLKSCNCSHVELLSRERRRLRKLIDPTNKEDLRTQKPSNNDNYASVDEFLTVSQIPATSYPSNSQMCYRLIASKQMVGIFVSVWARKELIPHIGHLRISSVGRGIMGCLGNKGCISISLSLHQTSFCFVCSHLASGEKEGDELKRNADVAEILKSTQFQKICKNPYRRDPEKIIDHDRVIWLGDLNYRVSLSYEETRVFLEGNDWDTLLEKDQLNMEREAGRVFNGFNEGRILFAPTYKYSRDSDAYAGETVKSKKKRRTPAWCDRILWRGDGIEQLSYIRGESRFSDHRPVCGVFSVDVEILRSRNNNNRFRKGYSCAAPRILDYDDCIPQRHSLYDY